MSTGAKSKRWLCMLAAVIIVAVVTGCGSSTRPQAGPEGEKLEGNIAISGAWALYPMMVTWAEKFQAQYPDVTIDVSAGGAGKGMADALAGAVDIGMVSRAITSEEEGKGAYWIAVVTDAVFPGINAENPVWEDLHRKGITQEQFIGMYITGEITTWGQVVGRPEVTDQIHVFTRSDSCGAAEVWAKYLGNRKQEDLKGVAVYGDPGLAEAVVKDPLGIGYNNLNYAYDTDTGKPVAGMVVVPIDVNGNGQADPEEIYDSKEQAQKAVATGAYPAPPARDLNLVTKGKPTGLVKAFIQWILTTGQQYVSEAGYIELPADKMATEKGKLD